MSIVFAYITILVPAAFISFQSNIYQVLSMSRLGGAGAVAQLVADIPLQSVEVINCEG